MDDEQKENFKSAKVVDIRKATLADNVRIYRILKEAFQSHETLTLPPINEDSAINWIISVIQNGIVYIAEYGGRIVGTIGLSPQELPWAEKNTSWYLNTSWLYVHPKYQGNSTVTKLVQKTIEFARGAKIAVKFDMSLQNKIIAEKVSDISDIKDVGNNLVYQIGK
jgi:predicted N-acetyltransferase YhbS